MAKSENQGLQVAVILLAILTILLSITTFLCFNKWTNSEKEAVAAAAEAAKSRANVEDTDRDLIALLAATTGSPQGSTADATARAGREFNEDLTRWQKAPDIQEGGFSLPKEKQSYHDALEEALTQLKNTKAAEAKIRADVKTQTTGELDPIQPTLATQFTAKDNERQNNATAFNTKKGENETKQKALFAENKTKAVEIKEKSQELTASQIKQDLELKETEKKVEIAKENDRVIAELLAKLVRKDFDGEDGHVVRVDNTSRTVWINLGDADNLRPQVLFRVYGKTPKGIETSQEKAELEVVRVLESHLAECRIIRDYFTRGSTVIDEVTGKEATDRQRYSLTNPIAPGDVIATPLWNPGDEIHYALAGSMDIDGDGQDDRALVKTLLAASGGLIDGEVLPDGTTIGRVELRTRYLIFGTQSDQSKEAIAKMNDAARQLGVESLTLEKLLDKLGASKVDPKEINKAKERVDKPAASPAEPFRRKPAPKAAAPAAPANGK